MKSMKKSKCPVVAFFNGNIHDPHSMTLIRLLYDGFQKDKIEFHYYMGTDLNGFLESNLLKNLRAENHYYSLFSYVAYDTPDLIILSMGGLTNSDDASSVEGFLSHFPKVPIIMLENDTEYPGVTHVLIDNYGGMYSAVKHLIEDHGYRNIAHLAGPQNNEDASVRKKAYQDAMKAHGLPEGMILYGDYTRSVEKQARDLLNTRPEAIASANDVMAETIYHIAAEEGLQIGKDLAVTGFDDTVTSQYMDPPLSTVRQDYKRIVDTILSQVRLFFRGEPLSDVRIPADFICRCSCGCRNEPSEEAEASHQLLLHQEQIEQMIFQELESTVTLRNMFYQEMNQELMFQELGQTLRLLGSRRSFILLHDEPIRRVKREVVDAPEYICMVLKQEGFEISSYSQADAPVIHKGELREAIQTEEPSRLTDFVLFFQDLEYGILIVDIDPDQLLFFYSLSLEIGSGLRYLQLFTDREAVYQTLEEKNQILRYSASHDSLTGLYNRAGIMNEILHYVRRYPAEDGFFLVMADLDHLKQINDTLGHHEGDVALQRISAILREIFPEDSPIGRNGGDEFLAVLHLEPKEDAEAQKLRLKQELHEACESANEQALPFYLGISAGFCEFTARDLGRLLQILEKADQDLYEAKKTRRDNVIR